MRQEPSQDQRGPSAMYVLGAAMVAGGSFLFGMPMWELPMQNSTSPERNVTLVGVGTVFKQASMVVANILVSSLIGLYFGSNVSTNAALSEAQQKLDSYLNLDSKEQRDFLLSNQTAVFDFLPAFRSQSALKSFVESEGLKNLGPDELVPMLTNHGPQGITLLGALPYPGELMEQNFFQSLDKETQLNIVFVASPRNYYLKKTYFLSLDLSRNLLLWKYILGKSLVALAFHEITFSNLEQARAFLEAVEQISGSFVAGGIRPVVINDLSSYLVAPPAQTAFRPHGLAALGASLTRAYGISDEIIVGTYGRGLTGLAKGSLNMVMFPIVDGIRLASPLFASTQL